MSDVLDELLLQLRLERLDERRFRGQSQDLGWGAVFGGQVLGQALSAAAQTVPADRNVHSMHAYFLRVGDTRAPITYEVEAVRDGTSFATRRVVAVQHDQPIFVSSASFQVEEAGFDHAEPAPLNVAGPDGLHSEQELATRVADQIPEPLRPMALADRPIEIRPVTRWNPLAPSRLPPRRQLWYRTSGRLPDDPSVHRSLLAYASDFNFLPTAMMPHGVSWITPGMQVASLDHAMWFHRPFRFDDWLLYDVESPSASGGRGLVLGRFYTRDGVLVASVAQEGLMRNRNARTLG